MDQTADAVPASNGISVPSDPIQPGVNPVPPVSEVAGPAEAGIVANAEATETPAAAAAPAVAPPPIELQQVQAGASRNSQNGCKDPAWS